MIERILLENFMAHARTELTLGPGLTVLVGPNNSGKSAVVEALRCLATNPAPRHCIRHGAKEARVEVRLSDGTRVAWVRRKAYALYEIYRPGQGEPQVYAKFGRKPPQDVLDALRLDLVAIETGDEIDVHLGNQREPIFLLNQPPSAAAAFFAASSESAHLLAMQNALKRRVLEARRDEAGLAARLEALESELDRLTPLPGIALRLDAARAGEEALGRLAAQVPALETALARLRDVAAERARLAARAQALGRAAPPPRPFPSAGLAGLLAERRNLAALRLAATLRGRTLAGLARPPEAFDAARLQGLLAGLALARRERECMAGRAALLEGARQAPAPFPTAGLADLLAGVKALAARRTRARQRADRLAGLADPPAPFDGKPLSGLLSGLREMSAQRRAAGERLAARGRALAECAARVAERLAGIEACPLCGSALTAEVFLAGGCTHGS